MPFLSEVHFALTVVIINYTETLKAWTDENVGLLQQTKVLPMLAQPSAGKLDGVVMVAENNGALFLYNPTARSLHGARFSAEIYARGCHWIPGMFAWSAVMRVTDGIPLGCSFFLPIDTVNCVQTLKAILRQAGWYSRVRLRHRAPTHHIHFGRLGPHLHSLPTLYRRVWEGIQHHRCTYDCNGDWNRRMGLCFSCTASVW
jgi:hypothetical protein